MKAVRFKNSLRGLRHLGKLRGKDKGATEIGPIVGILMMGASALLAWSFGGSWLRLAAGSILSLVVIAGVYKFIGWVLLRSTPTNGTAIALACVIALVIDPFGPRKPPVPATPTNVVLACRADVSEYCATMQFPVGEQIPLSVRGLSETTYDALCKNDYSFRLLDTQDPDTIYDFTNCDFAGTRSELYLDANWICPVPDAWTTTWELLDPEGRVILTSKISGTCYK